MLSSSSRDTGADSGRGQSEDGSQGRSSITGTSSLLLLVVLVVVLLSLLSLLSPLL